MVISKDILAALTYFDMFDYPLKKREIYLFLGHVVANHEFEQALEDLIFESAVFRLGEFYSLHNNYALAERRINGNNRAAIMLDKAHKAASFIAGFPFVKAVGVSGSLSKNYADKDADIDFFIITAANRLWIARTFLHVFKKLTFLFNAQHLFCMNYFIDESSPEIIEKNIYTATEVATLLPLKGNLCFDKFFMANSWTKNFLPNNYMRVTTGSEIKLSWGRQFIEFFFNNKMGSWLDAVLMMLTTLRWRNKTSRKKTNSRGVIMSLHAGKHFAKPDPANFQVKLLRQYELGLSEVLFHFEHPPRISTGLF